MKKSIILRSLNVLSIKFILKTLSMNELIQPYLDQRFNGQFPTIEQYKECIYQLWQDEHTRPIIFGNIPIAPNGFTTECPPIPWMGDIENAEYAVISLEPHLNRAPAPINNGENNFEWQVHEAGNFNGWNQFYFANYFHRYFPGQHVAGYWARIADFAGALSQNQNPDPVNVLTQTIVEIPLCPYHAQAHPNYDVPPMLWADFLLRLSFFCNQRPNAKCIVLGAKPSRLFANMGVVLANNLLDGIANQRDRTLRVRQLDNLQIFMRNAPFAQGWQLPPVPLLALANIIREYPNLQA